MTDEHVEQEEQQEEAAAEVDDRLLRLAADFENYKKRAARERQEYVAFANERILKELLPVLDDLERAQRHASRCLRLSRELGETGAAAESLITLALVASSKGDLMLTRTLLSESVKIARRGDNVGPLSSAFDFLAELELEQGDADAARKLFEEALVLRQAIGSTGWVAWSHSNLGLVAHACGELDEALDWYRRALACAQELGVTQLATECLIGIAAVAAKRSDTIRAARLLAASEGISGMMGHGGWLAEGALKEETLAEVRANLDEQSLASLWEEGRAMTLAEAVAAAR